MAENLGQIDVVVKSDNQRINLPGGAGGATSGFIGPPTPDALRKGGGGAGAAEAVIAGSMIEGMLTKFGGVAKALGIFGIAVGGAIAIYAVLAKALTTIIKTLVKWDRQTQKLITGFASLNGSAALALSIKSLGDFGRSLREAKALGPMLLSMQRAREGFSNVKSALGAAFNAIKITVLEVFFKAMSKLLTPLVDAFGGLEGLTKAARICTLALLDMASTFTTAISWISKIASWVPGGGGPALGALGDLGLNISKKIDEAIAEVKRGNDNAALKDDMAALREANGQLMAHLEHMTSGKWRYNPPSAKVPASTPTAGPGRTRRYGII